MTYKHLKPTCRWVNSWML